MRGVAAAIAVLGMALCLAAVGPRNEARAERRQSEEVIASLDGGLLPLRLPRDRPAPVGVRFEGGLRTDDGSLLPRVTRIEFGLLPGGVVETTGLPVCSARRLRNAKPPKALATCRHALVGRGTLEAEVPLPEQKPFTIEARLLLFNGRTADGDTVILVHAFAPVPPTVVVLPFVLRHRPGSFGTVLVADLPPALGPWPRLARFEMTLFRRFRFRHEWRSFLSASCPIPPRLTAGFFSLARATYTLEDRRRLEVEIARGCRGI